ncbi:MAG: hypothetical protein ACNA7J_00785 [Wenzhouxiangella sp.]
MSLLLAAQAQASMRVSHGLPGMPYTGMSWFMVAFELGPWDEYLIHELTPSLERLTSDQVPRVSWLHLDERLIIPDFAASLMARARPPMAFSLYQHNASLLAENSTGLTANGKMRFEQSLLVPGITHQVSDHSAVTVSAVLATQRFSAGDLNLNETSDSVGIRARELLQPHGHSEVAQGAGVRLAFSNDLLPKLTLEAAYQSRIEMAEFASLQGFHGSQAEFDIPSRVNLGMQFHVSGRASLSLGMTQIFYSEVGAFPSRTLPARFNALLGDSTSPQFEWEDLLVYSVGWRWRHENDFSFFLDYRTRSQPLPSSSVLAAALGPELAKNALLAGISKSLGARTQFQMTAAYAPPEFAFGGNALGIVSDKLDQGLEVQALVKFGF